jgi:hypothetical protein
MSLQGARCACVDECATIHVFIMLCMLFIHLCSSIRFVGSVCCEIATLEVLLGAMSSSAGPVRNISVMES